MRVTKKTTTTTTTTTPQSTTTATAATATATATTTTCATTTTSRGATMPDAGDAAHTQISERLSLPQVITLHTSLVRDAAAAAALQFLLQRLFAILLLDCGSCGGCRCYCCHDCCCLCCLGRRKPTATASNCIQQGNRRMCCSIEAVSGIVEIEALHRRAPGTGHQQQVYFDAVAGLPNVLGVW